MKLPSRSSVNITDFQRQYYLILKAWRYDVGPDDVERFSEAIRKLGRYYPRALISNSTEFAYNEDEIIPHSYNDYNLTTSGMVKYKEWRKQYWDGELEWNPFYRKVGQLGYEMFNQIINPILD